VAKLAYEHSLTRGEATLLTKLDTHGVDSVWTLC